ncbi:ABC transporter family substrate-binding protein [Micromonospora sp. DT228]|uniref:ABC transporter family substrate-binding protein n=1 Tax=Micromonospora sp. DT228 TaxID=3393443 RepID=UPI003CF58FD9
MQRRTLLAALVAAPLGAAVAACTGSGDKASTTQPPAAGVLDVTPTPREQIKDGGELVWPVADIPATFNFLQLGGTPRDNSDIILALLPSLYRTDAAGTSLWNRDYLAEEPVVTPGAKQVVTYKLSELAAWNDGTPITYADFEAQWKALNGGDEAYKVANRNGYRDIASVARGANDREVVVTYARPYTDWQAVFTPLYPRSTTSEPHTFNTAWVGKIPGPTAGPFMFAALDETARTVTLKRDPRWWGDQAKLERISYKGIEASAAADAVDNGEADFFEIAANVNLYGRARQMSAKVDLKRAGAPFYRHVTFNGARPHLADARVRRALALAINRETIAQALLGPLNFRPEVLGNRIYMPNHSRYQDNSGTTGAYRPQDASALLEEAGWTLSGTTRTKDGMPLAVDFVISSGVAESKTETDLIKTMLADVGVRVTIRAVPAGDFFSKHITPGNFDMAVFAWGGRPYPISINESIFANPVRRSDGQLDVRQSYARVGSDEIDTLFRSANSELDPAAAAIIANRIDGKLWQLMPNLPLYQRPDLWAVRKGLVNFGAFGYASRVYENIGWQA